MTEAQQKFKEKIKKDLNYEVDFATYHITRGRGWSKADGACSRLPLMQYIRIAKESAEL